MGECCTCTQHPRPQRRINGCQLPLNFQQVVGWTVFVVTALINFIIVIEIQFYELKVVSIIFFVILYVCHVSSHLTAALTDPSERELRKIKVSNVPEFDRSVHAHVIENGRCHLCNIYTSSKNTKHCSLCNKCVDHFDHHCKWLNNCVGERNYAAFITCVTTALLISLFTTVLCLTDIILFLIQPIQLSPSAQNFINCTSSGTNVKYCQNSITFITFLIIFGLCALAIACALLHLCCFHIYISMLGMSTYEYIVKGSHVKQSKNVSSKNKCCIIIISKNQNSKYLHGVRNNTSQTKATDDNDKTNVRESIETQTSIVNENRDVSTFISTLIANKIDRAKKLFIYNKNKIHPDPDDP